MTTEIWTTSVQWDIEDAFCVWSGAEWDQIDLGAETLASDNCSRGEVRHGIVFSSGCVCVLCRVCILDISLLFNLSTFWCFSNVSYFSLLGDLPLIIYLYLCLYIVSTSVSMSSPPSVVFLVSLPPSFHLPDTANLNNSIKDLRIVLFALIALSLHCHTMH